MLEAFLAPEKQIEFMHDIKDPTRWVHYCRLKRQDAANAYQPGRPLPSSEHVDVLMVGHGECRDGLDIQRSKGMTTNT